MGALRSEDKSRHNNAIGPSAHTLNSPLPLKSPSHSTTDTHEGGKQKENNPPGLCSLVNTYKPVPTSNILNSGFDLFFFN